MAAILPEVRSQLDAVQGLPADLENVQVRYIPEQEDVVSIIVTGPQTDQDLWPVVYALQRQLLDQDDIRYTDMYGVQAPYVSIYLKTDKLRDYGLQLRDVVQAVQGYIGQNGVGELRGKNGRLLLQFGQFISSIQALKTLPVQPVRTPAGGAESVAMVQDVADVRLDHGETPLIMRYNGMRAAEVMVRKNPGQDITRLRDQAYHVVENMAAHAPVGVTLHVWAAGAAIFDARLSLLLHNAVAGLCLVFVVLALFLHYKLAFWVSLGIGTAFSMSFALLVGSGISLNMLTLAGFIMVLGIVVDDAIVVAEGVYVGARQSGAHGGMRAVNQLRRPVLLAVATTCLAFVPLLWFRGDDATATRMIPIVALCCFLASLLDSFFVLPRHVLAASDAHHAGDHRWRLDRIGSAGLRRVRRAYMRVLCRCMRMPAPIYMLVVAMCGLAVCAVITHAVTVNFKPKIPADELRASIALPDEAAAADVVGMMQNVENAAAQFLAQMRADGVLSTTADDPQTALLVWNGGNYVQAVLRLPLALSRTMDMEKLAQQWRAHMGNMVTARAVQMHYTLNQGVGRVAIRVTGVDQTALQEATAILRSALASYAGVSDIRDTFSYGVPVLNLYPNDEALLQGYTSRMLSDMMAVHISGTRVGYMVQEQTRLPVYVQLAPAERQSITVLERMMFGGLPVSGLLEKENDIGFGRLVRENGMPSVIVYGVVDSDITNADRVVYDLKAGPLREIGKVSQDIKFEFYGSTAERNTFFKAYVPAVLGVIILIFMILALVYQSLWVPVLVGSALPLGAAGAVFGHFILGYDLSLYSFLGMLAAGGVVVNDNLVLLESYRQHQRAMAAQAQNGAQNNGNKVVSSAIVALYTRFRPIILTSLTTVVGLLPLMAAQNGASAFLAPMAVSLAFGVVFALLSTLFFVPCLIARIGLRLP
jgi:multidrug efflux pump subunit AcrB